MAPETPPPDGGRRKRPAPTIDLKATEVPVEPEATAAPESQPDEAPAEVPAENLAEQPAAEAREPFIPPPPERPNPHSAGVSSGEPEPDRRSTVPPSFARPSPWPMVGAGAAGAGGVLVAFILLWAIGAMPGGGQQTADLGPTLGSRLTAIETQLRDLATRPPPVVSVAPAGVDTKAIEGLSSRLDKLEAAASAPRQPVTDPAVLNRIGAVDSAVKSLSDNVNALAATTRGRVDARRQTFNHLRIGAGRRNGNDRRRTCREIAQLRFDCCES